MRLLVFESELFGAHPDSDKIRMRDSMKIFPISSAIVPVNTHQFTQVSVVSDFPAPPRSNKDVAPHSPHATEPESTHKNR